MVEHRPFVPLRSPDTTAQGYDPEHARLGLDDGGLPFTGRARGGRRPPIEYAQPPPAEFDGLNVRERGPWFHTPNHVPVADAPRWTDAGPIRPTLHMRTHTWRRWSGGSHSDRTGWHTVVPRSTRIVPARRQQRRPHQDRLTVARFRGQSYSQTTQVIGGE